MFLSVSRTFLFCFFSFPTNSFATFAAKILSFFELIVGGYFLMYSERSLESKGGIPLEVAPVGAELVHASAKPRVQI